MGTIIRVTNQHPGSIGCLNNLYQSVRHLPANKFSTECHNWSHYLNTPCCLGNKTSVENLFEYEDQKSVKTEMTFVITDDLRVIAGGVSSVLQLLDEFNITDVGSIVEIPLDVGLDKVVELLKQSLLSNTPLTDVFVQRQDVVTNTASSRANFVNMESEMISDGSKLSLKLLFTETDNILAAEANESFIDFLFSLCTIPLGSLIKLLDGDTQLGCIGVLYRSVQSMDPIFLNFPKENILDYGVLEQYKCNSMLLKIRSSPEEPNLLDPRSPNPSTECFGKFLKDNQLFIVFNNLTVKHASCVSSISFLKELNMRADDVKVKEVAIGKNEVLALIKASLTSSSALNVLKIFLEDKKPQVS